MISQVTPRAQHFNAISRTYYLNTFAQRSVRLALNSVGLLRRSRCTGKRSISKRKACDWYQPADSFFRKLLLPGSSSPSTCFAPDNCPLTRTQLNAMLSRSTYSRKSSRRFPILPSELGAHWQKTRRFSPGTHGPTKHRQSSGRFYPSGAAKLVLACRHPYETQKIFIVLLP